MTRVIHTGDTHLGYQQYNSPARRRDFLEAFRNVAEDAVSADVDAVIHAGDLFHDRRPGLVDLQGTIDVLRTLADANIPFLAVVGNHEGKRDAQWLDLFADIGLATRLGPDPEVVGDVAFYGQDFVPRSRREGLEYEFEPVPDAASHAALVSHGLFEPFAHADWDTERMLEEATVEFDAVLLGDNHKPDTAEVCDTWVTYCGSTERASASEREARGYNLVEFESAADDSEATSEDASDNAVAITRRSLTDTRDFVFVDVELEEGEGIDRVQERVRQHDVEDAVAIVTVEGDGRPITPAAVEELALDRGALVARMNDRRDIPDEAEEVSVSFADPDAAVRERIRDLGLSDAARSIDETVRNDDLPDSNVRESVERRVRDLLEDDRSAFEPAPERAPEDEDVTTVADQLSAAAADSGTGGTEDTKTSAAATADDEHPIDSEGDTDERNTAERETAEHDTAGEAESDTEPDRDADHASLGDFA
ncbi:DNA double-strand break repair protein Mre11 [Natrialba magadii ATCC 43099]|uniref:DNA double-strand break repair protein Mre11 n=1 Tax=Natrialba magadii (strain ATCC 43099 / DSM 3394 / CCM 3739 / CIP 104546 / IAM 13178 / JCM 8861 / NBRC 102185 / NCIMB 2190 / MS3) TaxID=547559 RepID=D3SXQ0_NATMM|nr:DNA double-strand break repair protein Mre11 [Natrialba magadii]ADD05999.1 DNA double-strand break repair protein Mre11 [Natrialba magadii ATCC 43099]ELY30492.1 metallophosphoesterase [Natrialba magadii ATCC 43099]